MAEGYLYALDNSSMPGVYKVGCTSRNPFDRARELRTTGVPSEFSVVMAYRVDDIRQAESTVHSVLDQRGHRVDRSREFFRVPYGELLRVFADHLGEPASASFSAEPVAPEPQTAEELFRRATELQHGQGDAPPDLGEAVRFFELATAKGHLEACRTLVVLHEENEQSAAFFRARLRELQTAQMNERTRKAFSEGSFYLAWLLASMNNSVPSLELILETIEERGVNLWSRPLPPGGLSCSVSARDLLRTLEMLNRTLPSAAAVDRWILERTATQPISQEDALRSFSASVFAEFSAEDDADELDEDDLDEPDERCRALEWLRRKGITLRVLDAHYCWGLRFQVLDALTVEDLPYPTEDIRAFGDWIVDELRPVTP